MPPKRASTQDIYLFEKFCCLLIFAISKKLAFGKQLLSQIRQIFEIQTLEYLFVKQNKDQLSRVAEL